MKTDKPEEMREEYNREELVTGIRGKYYEEYKKGTNIVLLSPDVAAAFPDDKSVNEALRGLLKLAKKSVAPASRPGRRTTPRG